MTQCEIKNACRESKSACSNPQYPQEKLGVATHAYTPRAGRWRQVAHRCLLASQPTEPATSDSERLFKTQGAE